MNIGWTDIEDIVLGLDEAHPEVDPTQVRFTRLRAMVEQLEEFAPEPGQTPNEQILEAIQAGWIEERGEVGPKAGGDSFEGDDDEEGDDDTRRYSPNQPFR